MFAELATYIVPRHKAMELVETLNHQPERYRDIQPVYEEEKPSEGTPSNQRTGRTHAYRSSTCRSVTLMLRIPAPTGVATGPFSAILRRIPNLEVDNRLCQEDWGVVVFPTRAQKKFWIGLSHGAGEHEWLGHFHHGVYAWLQRLTLSGKRELQRLTVDTHVVLSNEHAVSNVRWYEDPQQQSFSKPLDD
jgi:hypothetical protein